MKRQNQFKQDKKQQKKHTFDNKKQQNRQNFVSKQKNEDFVEEEQIDQNESQEQVQIQEFKKQLESKKQQKQEEKQVKQSGKHSQIQQQQLQEEEVQISLSEEGEENKKSIFENKFLTKDDIDDKRKLYIIMEKCPLETARLKKDVVLLNSDDHKFYISKKLNKDFSHYRPDILHQSLLTLMDSPLNKAGYLKVFIKTDNGVLIDISPNTKIPRTYRRFAALFAQLLSKLKIRAAESSETLLKVIKNPITQHLPAEAIKIGTSVKGRLVNFKNYASKLTKNGPICIVVGGVAKTDPCMEIDYTDETICISKYALSASCCLSRMIQTFEDMWGVE